MTDVFFLEVEEEESFGWSALLNDFRKKWITWPSFGGVSSEGDLPFASFTVKQPASHRLPKSFLCFNDIQRLAAASGDGKVERERERD